MTDLYYIRPGRPERIEWKDPERDTKAVRVLLEEMVGLTKVDESALEIHQRTHGSGDG